MRLKYRPMAIMGFTLLSVLFVCLILTENAAIIATAIGAVLLIISLVFKKIRECVFPIFLAVSLIAGGLIFIAENKYGFQSAQEYIDKDVQITARIKDYPEQIHSRYHYIVETESIDNKKAEYTIQLSTPFELDAEPYDTIKMRVHVYAIGVSDGNILLYYKSKGIFLGSYAYNTDDYKVEVIKNTVRPLGLRMLEIRNTIKARILDKLPNEYGGIAVGMLLGDKSSIGEETSKSIYDAGIAPLFAVSGLHLSIWVMGLYELLEQLRVKKRINSVIGIVFTLVFMSLTDFSNSVCRAGLMMILLLIGNLFYRKPDSVNSLGFAVLILCVINPFIAADVGFLMSFSSTLGIITIYPILTKRLYSKISENFWGRVIKAFLSLILVSVCAIIGSISVNILFFEYFSVLSVVTNFLVSYAATFCMVFAGFSALFFNVKFISDCFALIAGIFSKYIVFIINKLANLCVPTISTSSVYWKVGTVLCLAVLVFSLLTFKKKAFVKSICVGMSVVIVVCSCLSYIHFNSLTEVRILNVEDGVCVVAFRDDRKIALGSSADYYYTNGIIAENLEKISRRNSNLLIIPQNCSDNEDTLALLKEVKFNKIIVPQKSNAVSTLAGDENVEIKSNVEIDVWSGAKVRFVSCDSYSLAFCTFDSNTMLLLFSSKADAKIPSEFVKADFFVCCGYIPNCIKPTNFGTTIISAEYDKALSLYKYVAGHGAYAISTATLGDIVLSIKNGKVKVTARGE